MLSSVAKCSVQLPRILAPSSLPLQARSYYTVRKDWFEWRRKMVKTQNHEKYLNKTIFPTTPQLEDHYAADEKTNGMVPRKPIKKLLFEPKGGRCFRFKEDEVRVSLRKLQNYSVLLRHKHLQDGIDWIGALCRPSIAPLSKLLKRAKNTLVEKAGLDFARLYIETAVREKGKYQKKMFKTRDGKYTIRTNHNHSFIVRVREMPMEEFFHRVYIEKRVPRAIVMDMTSALRDGRAAPEMARDFAPYVTSASRHQHRKEMKYMSKTGRFDYFKVRDEWIAKYQANIDRYYQRKREARGLAPTTTFTNVAS